MKTLHTWVCFCSDQFQRSGDAPARSTALYESESTLPGNKVNSAGRPRTRSWLLVWPFLHPLGAKMRLYWVRLLLTVVFPGCGHGLDAATSFLVPHMLTDDISFRWRDKMIVLAASVKVPRLQLPSPLVLPNRAGCRQHHCALSQSERRGTQQADALLLTSKANKSIQQLHRTQCSI